MFSHWFKITFCWSRFPNHIEKLLVLSIKPEPLTGIQLVADISATSPHHFLVFCHIFASFWRKIKVDIDLESGESRASIQLSGITATIDLLGFRRSQVEFPSAEFDNLLALRSCQKTCLFLNQDQKFCTNSYVDSGGKQEVKVHNHTHRTTLGPFLLNHL